MTRGVEMVGLYVHDQDEALAFYRQGREGARPEGLFNASLEGNFPAGDRLPRRREIDEAGLKALLRAAAALNVKAPVCKTAASKTGATQPGLVTMRRQRFCCATKGGDPLKLPTPCAFMRTLRQIGSERLLSGTDR